MALLASFLVNALANFALGLLLARFLGAETFGLYAVAVAGAAALASPALDWLRHAAARFAFAGDAATRATLDAAAMAVVGALGLLAALGPMVLRGAGDPLVAALALGFSTLNALFDFRTALARALSLTRVYAGMMIARAIVLVTAMPLVAAGTGSPASVLIVGTAGLAAVLLWGARRLPGTGQGWRSASVTDLRRFGAYGVPLMAAGGLAMVQAFYTRAAVASEFGLAEAGRFALSYDIGIRIVAVTSTAIDVLVFQWAVRASAGNGRDAGLVQVGANLTIVTAVLMPTIVGYGLVLPHVEAALVPPGFQGSFARYSLALLPGLGAWAFILFGLSPAFQILGRTWPMLAPHLVALAGTMGLGLLLSSQLGPIGYAVAFSVAMLAALALAAALVARLAPVPVQWPQLGRAVAATSAMAAAAAPFAWAAPSGGMLVLAAGSGALAFAIAAFTLDLAGVRTRRKGDTGESV